MSCVLGIESSCDETGVAVVQDGRRILSNEIASQANVHARYGGVVPEIASRQHILCISHLTERAMDEAASEIDAVAATVGPGLMGSLLVGVGFARALAYARDLPFVPVHHIEGHIFSVFLAEEPPTFPFLTLVVSGGHTSLVWCKEPHRYEILGNTRDDAVGESFDKVARLLGLPYPGGPSIEQAAKDGDPQAIAFPRAMTGDAGLDFSYSGLKTAVLYELRKNDHAAADVAASFQAAAVETLVLKTGQAIEQTGAPRLVVAGGVAANKLLREKLQAKAGVPVSLPPLGLCIDNGAMIAAAADSRLRHDVAYETTAEADPGLALC